jgi:uncharacterized membrane protein YgdD (TMEM256/DUF423 family)
MLTGEPAADQKNRKDIAVAKGWISIGAISAAFSVVLGAFGAHGLEGHLRPEALDAFKTGVQYQFYHSLGLILIGVIASSIKPPGMLSAAGWMMLAGIILFSGSLYLLSTTGMQSFGVVAPFGGLSLIVAWLMLAFGILRQPGRSKR